MGVHLASPLFPLSAPLAHTPLHRLTQCLCLNFLASPLLLLLPVIIFPFFIFFAWILLFLLSLSSLLNLCIFSLPFQRSCTGLCDALWCRLVLLLCLLSTIPISDMVDLLLFFVRVPSRKQLFFFSHSGVVIRHQSCTQISQCVIQCQLQSISQNVRSNRLCHKKKKKKKKNARRREFGWKRTNQNVELKVTV